MTKLAKLDKRYPFVIPLIWFVGLGVLLFKEALLFGYVLNGNIDRTQCLYPFHLISKMAWDQGVWPQWNPWMFCGTSFLYSTQNQIFYPPLWLVYSLPSKFLAFGITSIVAAHMILAAWFAFYVLLALRCTRLTSVIFATAYMLSSSMIMNAANELFSLYLMLLPLCIYILLSFKQRGRMLSLLYLSCVYSLLLINGVTNVNLYIIVLAFTVCFYEAFVGINRRSGPSIIITNGAAVTLGACVAAVKILPFIYDTKFYLNARVTFESFVDAGWTPYEALLRMFMPHFFGEKIYPTSLNVLAGEWLGRQSLGFMNNYEAMLIYSGVPAAIMTIYVILFMWTRASVMWKLAFFASIATACGGPLAYLHYVSTGSVNLHFGRVAMLMPLYVSLMGGLGWMFVRKSHYQLKRLSLLSLSVLVVVSGVALLISRRVEKLLPSLGENWPFHENAIAHFWLAGLLFTILVVCAQIWFGRVNRKYFDVALLALVFGDLAITSGIDKNSSRAFLAPAQELTGPAINLVLPSQFTKERDLRVLAVDPASDGGKAVHLGAYTMSGLDQGAPGLISALYWHPRIPQRMDSRSVSPSNPETAERVLQLTSTGLVVTPQGIATLDKPLRRFNLFSDYRVVPDPNAQRELLLKPSFDYLQTLLVSGAPNLVVNPLPLSGSVRKLYENANQIDLLVEASDNALLLMTDTFYPGWSATINGASTPVLLANAAFRAIAVPAGQSSVSFKFVHPLWKAGTLVSWCAITILATLACVARFGMKKNVISFWPPYVIPKV